MKESLNEVLEFFSFLVLMAIIGMGTIIYVIFVFLYWMYAVLTGKEHLIK
jgi:hypothetical protein